MAQAFLIQKSGGGGVNQTLPEQVTAFHAAANNTPAVVLTWTNPTEYFAGVAIVKKIGSVPESPTDGEKIYSGTAETFTDADVQFDTEYFYRAFAFNAKKQYQTLYAMASATPLNGIKPNTLPVGSLIKMNVGGVATDFLVVHQGLPSSLYDESCNGTWLLMKDCYTQMTTGSDYKTSAAHLYINETLLAKFANPEVIKTVKIPYYNGKGSTGVLQSGENGLSCNLFLLSTREMGGDTTVTGSNTGEDGDKLSYFDNVASDLKRIAYYENSAVYWWLRSPRTNTSGGVMSVSTTGNITNLSPTVNAMGVRPALILADNALLSPEPNADGSYTLIEEVA